MGFATIPVPPSRFPGHYSNSLWHLPWAQHTVRKTFHPRYCICGVPAASLHYSQQGFFANLALLTTSLGLEGLVLLLVQPAKQGEMYSVVFFRHTGLKFCLEH